MYEVPLRHLLPTVWPVLLLVISLANANISRNNPQSSCIPLNDLTRERFRCAMSRLLPPSRSPSYFPLSQTSHIDEDNESGKETTRSIQAQGRHYFSPHCLQLAMIAVLLVLAATAGFFVGLSFPRNQLASSSLPDTVPQGSLFPPTSPHATR